MKDILSHLIELITDQEKVYNNYFVSPLLKYQSLVITGGERTGKSYLARNVSGKREYVVLDENNGLSKEFILNKVKTLAATNMPFILVIQTFDSYPGLKKYLKEEKKKLSLGFVSMKANRQYGLKLLR